MKPLGIAAVVLVACTAGFAGALVQDFVAKDNIEGVRALVRAETGIRIALVDLEEVARGTKQFKERKIVWEIVQSELKHTNDKTEAERQKLRADILRLQQQGGKEAQIMSLRVELQALEETQRATLEEQQKYLSALLAQYQKEVLVIALDKVDAYAKLHGFDIVIQDFSADADDAGFFSGGAFTQTILSKPVVAAPGVLRNANAYVVDITEAVK